MRRRRPRARIERSEIGRKLRVCAQRSEHIAQPRRRIAAGNSRSRMRIAAGNSRRIWRCVGVLPQAIAEADCVLPQAIAGAVGVA